MNKHTKGNMMRRIFLLGILTMVSLSFSTTRYVRASGGNDANDGSSFALGWATLAFAFDAGNANRLAPGDSLRVCGDTGTWKYTLSASVSPVFASAPNINTPVYILGSDTSTGAVLTSNDQVTITTASELTNGLIYMTETTNLAFILWQNIKFDGGGSGMAAHCINTAQSDDFESMTFVKCRITNASVNGILSRMPNSCIYGWKFDRCEIDNNGKSGTGNGLTCSNNGRGAFFLYECSIHDNDSVGVMFGGSLIMNRCLVYDNGLDGVRDWNASTGTAAVIDNCVFFSNGSDGLEFSSSANAMYCKNNIFMNNAVYGVYCTNADMDRLKLGFWGNNCYYNNGTNPTDVNGNVPLGAGNITTNPLLTDTVTTRNFTLQAGSPCLNAGINPLGY